MDNERFMSKGYMTFSVELYEDGEASIVTETQDYNLNDEIEKEWYATRNIYSLMTGKEFLECVRSGGFINYDGSITDIFIDGYRSNLGLNECGISQGEFKVNGLYFESLCNEHEIKVNWANK